MALLIATLLQEQSENRWLQLIDQAKQEATDERKRLGKLLITSEEKNQTLVEQLAKTQQLFHDKSRLFDSSCGNQA